MKKFWNFIRDEANGERILRLEGPIDEDNFWGDEITPDAFRDDLEAEPGDVTVWLNSPGGNVFAANQIYNMLKEHKGSITVKIDAIAASAASVVAMAGDKVLMSPVSMLMIHDPMTMAMGNTKDMEAAIRTLDEVKESIINAYKNKTGLSHNKIAQLMSDETWMNAKKAVDLGFADEILYSTSAGSADATDPADAGKNDKEDDKDGKEEGITLKAQDTAWEPYHARLLGQSIWGKLTGCTTKDSAESDKKIQDATDDKKDMESSEGTLTSETPESAPVVDKPKEPEEETPSGDNHDDPPDKDEPDQGDGTSEDNPEQDNPDEEKPPVRKPKGKTTDDNIIEKPLIGMDGKTKDGSMPYAILERELQLLR